MEGLNRYGVSMCEPDCACRGNCVGEYPFAGPVSATQGVLDLDQLDFLLGSAVELAERHGAPNSQVDRFRRARWMIPLLRSRLLAADAAGSGVVGRVGG